MKKSNQIAAALNKNQDSSNNFKAVAEQIAAEIGVGLYWYDLTPAGRGLQRADVWQIKNGQWTRKLGYILLTHKGEWRGCGD